MARVAAERKIGRSAAVRVILDLYLDGHDTPVDPHTVRLVYARLQSKLPDTPVSFSAPSRRMRTYRLCARVLRARSLAGLLTLATHSVCGLPGLTQAA